MAKIRLFAELLIWDREVSVVKSSHPYNQFKHFTGVASWPFSFNADTKLLIE